MIDGVSSQPFSANTMLPPPPPEKSLRDEVIESSRTQFALKRNDIEKSITDWHKPAVVVPKPRIDGNTQPINHSPQPARVTPTETRPSSAFPDRSSDYNRDHREPQRVPDRQPERKPEPRRELEQKVDMRDRRPEPHREPVRPVPVPVMEREAGDDFIPLNKTISLSELKPKVASVLPLQNNSRKIPSEKNVNDLRQALASIVGEKKPQVSNSQPTTHNQQHPKSEIKQEIKEELKQTPQHQVERSHAPASDKQEVPEDVLKKILDINS
jgi:hypothetical protein